MRCLLLLWEGRPGAMLLLVERTLSAIAARARLLQGNVLLAAFAGRSGRRSVTPARFNCVYCTSSCSLNMSLNSMLLR